MELFAQLRELGLNERPVGRVGIIDPCAILRSDVVALLVERCRIYREEVELQEHRERQHIRLIHHLHSLCKARAMRAHLLVRRVFAITIGIARLGVEHSVDLFEEMFRAPKASSGEIDFRLLMSCLIHCFVCFHPILSAACAADETCAGKPCCHV